MDSTAKTRIDQIVLRLRVATKGMTEPMTSSIIKEFGRNPFLILISCLLSLRTRDVTTLPVARALFAYARDPQSLVNLSPKKIEKIIHPVGFYHKKALTIQKVSKEIIDRFDGKVPAQKEALLSLPGVGMKTANLVLAEGFGVPAICVDTHVHRISNRLGIIHTKTPLETEKALQKVLPKKYWIEFNGLLVMWGQNICVPVSPYCSKCAIYDLCERIGVKKMR